MNVSIKYAVLEGDPVVMSDRKAWTYLGGEWKHCPLGDAFMKAVLISEVSFKTRFAHSPQLATTAFQEGAN
jgi:hypothetical protein